MSLSKCKCWYSNNCLHFLKCTVPLCHNINDILTNKLRQYSRGFFLFSSWRITPFLPNWFINIVSPVIDVRLAPFWIGTFIGVAPPSFVAIQVRFCSLLSQHWRCSYHSKVFTLSDKTKIRTNPICVTSYKVPLSRPFLKKRKTPLWCKSNISSFKRFSFFRKWQRQWHFVWRDTNRIGTNFCFNSR